MDKWYPCPSEADPAGLGTLLEPKQLTHNTMNTRAWSVSLVVSLVLSSTGTLCAQAVRGANGHFYELVSHPYITWTEAKAAAEATLRCGQPGHLVTITSAEEQDFLVTSFGGPNLHTKWMGAFQPVSTDDDNGWEWVTGEPFVYTNWGGLEPNNTNYGPYYGYEDAGNFYFNDGTWNDAPSGWNLYGAGGYVVEWDVDATVIIDGCDTGVANAIVEASTNCTISDLIGQCAAEPSNHGNFVRCVAQITNALKAEGTISGAEKGRIQSCAAQAAIP